MRIYIDISHLKYLQYIYILVYSIQKISYTGSISDIQRTVQILSKMSLTFYLIKYLSWNSSSSFRNYNKKLQKVTKIFFFNKLGACLGCIQRFSSKKTKIETLENFKKCKR